METHDCFGWPVAASALTDILLWVEDCLDLDQRAFVRLVGARDILTRMNGYRDIHGEDLVVYTASIAATLTSACCDKDILAVSARKVVRVLHEIASDNGINTLVLSDYELPEGVDQWKQRMQKTSVVYDQLREEEDLALIEESIVTRRTELVISYASPLLTKRLYDKFTKIWAKPLTVVQLPYTGHASPKAVWSEKIINAKLHSKLAILALSGNFSSESK